MREQIRWVRDKSDDVADEMQKVKRDNLVFFQKMTS